LNNQATPNRNGEGSTRRQPLSQQSLAASDLGESQDIPLSSSAQYALSRVETRGPQAALFEITLIFQDLIILLYMFCITNSPFIDSQGRSFEVIPLLFFPFVLLLP